MEEEKLVGEINKILKSGWSQKQASLGKWIEVQWAWAGVIGKVVHKYKECGWVIKKQIELGPEGSKRVWLVFINPNWSKGLRELPY